MPPDPPTGAPPSAAPFPRTPSPENLDPRQHDVYGKRQTANGKTETFAVSLQLCVQKSEII